MVNAINSLKLKESIYFFLWKTINYNDVQHLSIEGYWHPFEKYLSPHPTFDKEPIIYHLSEQIFNHTPLKDAATGQQHLLSPGSNCFQDAGNNSSAHLRLEIDDCSIFDQNLHGFQPPCQAGKMKRGIAFLSTNNRKAHKSNAWRRF